ncbi:hypothetical protein TYRP_008872 [Tyrophagus putrescentiae]|nr:hypothetical protein TYRP_008872 [Tyrophagus putrescentiae]
MASSPYVSVFGEIKSVIGGRAELPCNLTLPSPDDAIQLIFWYRGNASRVPIYTIDSRTATSLVNATHFPSSDIFSPNRATFQLNGSASPQLASLIIEPVEEADHGDYKCRVDFRWSRTISSFVSLHIIVPPKRIAIRDQHGNYVHNSTIGPFNQNSDVILTCESLGGIPPPVLFWYKNGVMIDGSYVVGKNSTVRNELTVYKLSPRDLLDRYVCQTGNFNGSHSPIEAHVTIDINLLPVDVRILSTRSQLFAGRKVDVRCVTHGSKPAAAVRWLKNNVTLANVSEFFETNKTESSITLMPTMEDNGVRLQCRAYNPKLPDKYIEDVWTLQVLYKPYVQLTVGDSNQSNVVEEGSKVLIECQVSANPPLVDLQILHDSKPIHRLEHLDVLQENITRVLVPAVNSTHRGRYQCVASNKEGTSRSNDVQLDVLYVPFCVEQPASANNTDTSIHPHLHSDHSEQQPPTPPQYALSLNESVRLQCSVNANPPSNHFYWTLNEDTPQHHLLAQSDGASNELTFTASSLDTFGKVRCWAKNRIGMQREACLFVVTKAGPPAPLDGCSVTNKTTTSLNVECIPGDSGGSRQHFIAHVFQVPNDDGSSAGEGDLDPLVTGAVGGGGGGDDDGGAAASISGGGNEAAMGMITAKMNLTSEKSPAFYLTNLSPGTSYMIELYASNSRGQSDRSRLRVMTLLTKNTKLISSSLQEIEYDPLYGGVIGALLIALCLVTVAFVFCRLRQRQISRRTKQRKAEEQIKQNFAFRPTSSNQSYAHQDKEDAMRRPCDLTNGAAFSVSSSNNNNNNNNNNDSHHQPDIIISSSYENMSSVKQQQQFQQPHDGLYVIKEPLSLGEMSTSSVASLGTSSSLMIGQQHQQQQFNEAAGTLTMQSLGSSGHHHHHHQLPSTSHVSALTFQTPSFLTPSALTMATQTSEGALLTSSAAFLGDSAALTAHHPHHHHQQHPSHHQQQQQFFISAPPPEAILYAASTASAATLHPQIVAFNDKVTGWLTD